MLQTFRERRKDKKEGARERRESHLHANAVLSPSNASLRALPATLE